MFLPGIHGVITGRGPVLPANYIIVESGKRDSSRLLAIAFMITFKACRESRSPLISSVFENPQQSDLAMLEPELQKKQNPAEAGLATTDDIQPSWKPLLWFGGSLVALIALWEVFLELGMNIFELLFEVLEHIWLVLIEAPEEMLEDALADWLKNHFPHEAYRYSEIATAIGLTPLKLLLLFFAARWGWRRARAQLWPRVRHWFHIRVTEVKLAWAELAWPYRFLGGILVLGLLILLI